MATQPIAWTKSEALTHIDWDLISESANVLVALTHYRASHDLWPPEVTQPEYVSEEIPLTVLIEPDEMKILCAELHSHLDPNLDWGIRVEFARLPRAVEPLARWQNSLWTGPFSPGDRSKLQHTLINQARVRWISIQDGFVHSWILHRASGLSTDSINSQYLSMTFENDITEKWVAEGPVAVFDANLRRHYRKLAHNELAKGNRGKAAEYSFVAVNTLPLTSEVSSSTERGQTSVLTVAAVQLGESAFGDGDDTEDSHEIFAELLEEFADLRTDWLKLSRQRQNARVRLSTVAAEGLAVWAEGYQLRLEACGVLQPLFYQYHNESEQSHRANYMSYSPSNHYRRGLTLFDRLEAKIGASFLWGCHGLDRLLFTPLDLVSPRVPNSFVKALPKTSFLAPNARLEQLAAADLPSPETDIESFLRAAYKTLDKGQPGPFELVQRCLNAEIKQHNSTGRNDVGEDNGSSAINISWPCTSDAIEDITYAVRGDRLELVISPGSEGLRFNRRNVKFTHGSDHEGIPPMRYRLHRLSRLDERPLTVSVPYLPDRPIHGYRYWIEDERITIQFLSQTLDYLPEDEVKFDRGSIHYLSAAPPPNEADDTAEDHNSCTNIDTISRTYNVSWPCEKETIESVSHNIKGGRLDLIITPSRGGLQFDRRRLRFTEGDNYRSLPEVLPPIPDGRPINNAPLAVSIPYEDGQFERAVYFFGRGYVTLQIVVAESGRALKKADFRFTRLTNRPTQNQDDTPTT